ncbi:hypothetical protein PILCRDRAFT_823602 [Piloderma croceum F 1598]|uniref:Uncharacterized protein n=1 Tax=Piloderma croceum (strain F 1598) TaxID=765440 RepID=A0A0C3AZC1_PILCF|nr:hypothetical protein PILCRDRAFT_823602 [Piloderma croceum F 1598]
MSSPAVSSASPELGSAAKSIASNVEAAMTGLFKLQTTLVNVPGGGGGLPELHQNVDVIRQVFRYTWECIKTFFQNCQAFGSDVSNLKESLGTESAEDCIELLGEMSDGAVYLLEQAEELLDGSKNATKELARGAPGFAQHLQQATRISDVTSPLVSNETASFIAANLAAAYPNGSKALSDTQVSLNGITSSLETIRQFWESTSKNCQMAVSHRRLNITAHQAEVLAERWQGYQLALSDSINSITKTCDALVHPVGAPQPQRPVPVPPRAFLHAPRSNKHRPSRSRISRGSRDLSPPQPDRTPGRPIECWILAGLVIGVVLILLWRQSQVERRQHYVEK